MVIEIANFQLAPGKKKGQAVGLPLHANTDEKTEMFSSPLGAEDTLARTEVTPAIAKELPATVRVRANQVEKTEVKPTG